MQIGIVGLGFMGRMHLANWNRCQGAQVVAICEKNAAVLNDLDKPVGNIEGAQQAIDLSTVHLYSDLDQMLQSERLDAVSIALPTYLHADSSIKALDAGVHVLCEKPMAPTLEQCDAMIAAAQRNGRQLMIGHCIRFWPEYVKAKELIDSGQYGQVLSASFQRLTAAPTWSSDNWLMDGRLSGGMPLDLHIHDTDFIHYLFGIPAAVCSAATVRDEAVVHIHTHYDYGDKRAITAEASWLPTPSFGFEMSFNIMLERATLVFDCTREPMFRLCPAEGAPFSPPVDDGDGYAHEIAYFADLIQGKAAREVLTPLQSRESVRIVAAEQCSALEGRNVQIN